MRRENLVRERYVGKVAAHGMNSWIERRRMPRKPELFTRRRGDVGRAVCRR